MFCRCLYLSCFSLFAASLLPQSCTSSSEVTDPGVSLTCNQTEWETMTINCSIYYYVTGNCIVKTCSWCDTDGQKNICKVNDPAELHITFNVPKEDNYTIKVWTDCGDATSTVRVQRITAKSVGKPDGVTPPETQDRTRYTVFSIFFALCVLGMLCFVFWGRERRKSFEPCVLIV